MKKILILLTVIMSMASCTKEDYKLGRNKLNAPEWLQRDWHIKYSQHTHSDHKLVISKRKYIKSMNDGTEINQLDKNPNEDRYTTRIDENDAFIVSFFKGGEIQRAHRFFNRGADMKLDFINYKNGEEANRINIIYSR